MGPAAVPPLMNWLKRPRSNGRSLASRLLTKLGEPAVPPLIDYLKDADPVGLDMTMMTLGQIRDPRAVEPLINRLKDPDAKVRSRAALSLLFIGDLRSEDPLIACLHDSDPGVRRCAAMALGSIRDAKSVAPLRALLPDWPCHTAIVGTLNNLAWQPQGESEQVYQWAAASDAQQLKAHWDQSQRVLYADLRSGEYRRVENAAYTFIELGDVEAIAPMIEALNKVGDQAMAERYLSSRQKDLAGAARAWAGVHGVDVEMDPGGNADAIEWKWWNPR